MRLKRRHSVRRRRQSRGFNRRVRTAVHAMADKKYFDVANSGTNFSNTSGVQLIDLSGIAEGASDSQRVGTQITLRSLKLRFRIYGNTSISGNTPIRLIVGCWNDFISSSPASSALVTNITNNSIIAPYVRSQLQAKKWIPMYDRSFLIANSDEQISGKIITLNFKGKTLPKKTVHYTPGSVPDHNYFFWITNDITGVTLPGYQLYGRVTWTDV